ncbi:hypothetical protein RI129_006550 [Pyrocoelia pectoralis]|uniref:RING-type domain-containing protein n=1 Tax=Pyrocoelia pectoralis TaxID=417401 RepID=A0AAN7VAX9_9COLE
MADWVHCNRCFTRYDSNSTIYITTCGHMQCERCTAKSDKNKCVVCKSPCDIVPLNNSLTSEMQPFFLPPTHTFDKAKQVCMFQEKNMTNLLKNQTKKYNYLKSELVKAYKMIHDIRKEHEKIRIQIKDMAKKCGSTPMPSAAPPIFPSPVNSFTSSIFPNQQNSIPSSTSISRGSATWVNRSNLPTHRIAYRQPSNVEHSFMTPSQSSMADNTMEESFVREAIPRIAGSTGPVHRRPTVMMPMSRLNKPR